jgi:hypothetical protein
VRRWRCQGIGFNRQAQSRGKLFCGFLNQLISPVM